MKQFVVRVFKQPKTVVKFFVALVGAVGVAVSLGLVPDDAGKWAAVVVAFLTSLGVYKGANAPDSRTDSL